MHSRRPMLRLNEEISHASGSVRPRRHLDRHRARPRGGRSTSLQRAGLRLVTRIKCVAGSVMAHVHRSPRQCAQPAWPTTRSIPVAALWPGFEFDYAQTRGDHGHVYPGVRRMLSASPARASGWARSPTRVRIRTPAAGAPSTSTPASTSMVCGDTLSVRKPDPSMLHHALRALQCEPEDALYVGDSVIDVRTAHAPGVPIWAVTHGYGGPLRGADAPDRTRSAPSMSSRARHHAPAGCASASSEARGVMPPGERPRDARLRHAARADLGRRRHAGRDTSADVTAWRSTTRLRRDGAAVALERRALWRSARHQRRP